METWWLANSTTAWLILGPLIAAYAPRQLPLSFFSNRVWRYVEALLAFLNPDLTVDIVRREWDDYSIQSSNAYNEVKAYLTAECSRDARAFRAEATGHGDKLLLGLRLGQKVADVYGGAIVWWQPVEDREDGQRFTRRCFRLAFHRSRRDLVVGEYIPHVLRRGREALLATRRRRLYSNNIITDNSYWEKVWDHVYLDHPTTFDTLAMDPARKKGIVDDLDAFRDGREYYARVGKPWKRGYLLHGPPGTGKSSMVAAMANHLGYDIYDVELTVVHHNHDLRKLLVEITDKSIIVIEDIDCSLDLTGERRRAKKRSSSGDDDDDKPSKVTLSGLLNFIDGLWSACGKERIVVFTTNHVDKLDPALIRRGRMDMHIEMSYCCFEAFRTLAKNYLGVDEHPLFGAIRELLGEVNMTPADIAECLMTSKGRGVESCLEHLIEELKKAKAKAQTDEADAEDTAAAAPAEAAESAEQEEKI
ncbi:unnamed protein product [Urochloa decumbens]|uniref:AAA+ ATPase domain-containing protein n=1 Tax=Urochloa decumbens TaxID=240449 RepID=A0ABC9FJN9_9POAL